LSRIVQEKFQVDYPQQHNDDAESGWKSDKSARVKKGTPGREGLPGGDWPSKWMDNSVFYESLPPGADLEHQEMMDGRVQPLSRGNLGTGDQVTTDVTLQSLRTGYDRKKLLSTDDMYTREHNDAFYDVVKTDDGEEAFLERNNMLDRL
jgi:hypothetical protein